MVMRNYFSDEELNCNHCGENHFNDETLARLNKMRFMFGAPMVLSSAYRCKEYNELKGYTQTHATGQAVDVLCAYGDTYELVELALEVGFTGIGVNQKGDPKARFIHLDDLDNEDGTPRPRIWSY